MYDAFAPSSTPSTGRIIDYLSLEESYHTFTADVTNAYFHVDEDEECYVDPPAEWLEQQAASENPTSVLWRLRKQLYGRRRAGTRWVDFMAERLEEQSFDRCEAAPQFFVNYALDVSIEVHMDDLHGTGPKQALDVVRTNVSQTIRFKVWTVYEVGLSYEHHKRERVLHEDRTEIVPHPKDLRVVLCAAWVCQVAHRHHAELDPSSRGLTMMLSWTRRNADSTVASLGACNTCRSIAATCNSRQTFVRRR